MQRQDFDELLERMIGLPVTIRLLDPPLHEFLPKTDEEIDEVARNLGVGAEKLRSRAAELHEFNPMLGFRGVRLAIRYPEIAEMQARAIFEGAVEAGRKAGAPVTGGIMVPPGVGRPQLDIVEGGGGDMGGAPRLDRLRRDGASRLCLMLAIPHSDRPPRRGAGRARAQGRVDGVSACPSPPLGEGGGRSPPDEGLRSKSRPRPPASST